MPLKLSHLEVVYFARFALCLPRLPGATFSPPKIITACKISVLCASCSEQPSRLLLSCHSLSGRPVFLDNFFFGFFFFSSFYPNPQLHPPATDTPHTTRHRVKDERTTTHRLPSMSSSAMSVQVMAPARIASAALSQRRHRGVAVTAAVGAKKNAYMRTGRRASVTCRASAEEVGAETAEVLDGSSLFLVGMMGTGKSSVGKKLAAALGYNFFDT